MLPYATLSPLPAQLAPPASAWSMVSSTVLLYRRCLQRLLTECVGSLSPTKQTEITMHFAGFSAGSYTAIWKLTTASCVSTSKSPSAQTQQQWEPLPVQCSIWVALLSPAFQPDTACLSAQQRASHMSGKTHSVFGNLKLMSSSPCLRPSGRNTPIRLYSSKVVDSGDTVA